MLRRELICASLVVVGIILFLYGANFFDSLIGWIGVCLIIGGILLEIIIKIYENIGKNAPGGNGAQICR